MLLLVIDRSRWRRSLLGRDAGTILALDSFQVRCTHIADALVDQPAEEGGVDHKAIFLIKVCLGRRVDLEFGEEVGTLGTSHESNRMSQSQKAYACISSERVRLWY